MRTPMHETPALWILNGPNLNRIEHRDPHLYGSRSLSQIMESCAQLAHEAHFAFRYEQTNCEGQLIDWVQEAAFGQTGLIINPGAYAHTSIALMDAVACVTNPVIEVHLSNIHARESFRQTSYLSKVVIGTIAGFKENSYILAIHALIDHFKKIKQ